MPSLETYFEASMDFMRGDRCGDICLQFQGQRQIVPDSQPSLFSEIQASKKPFLKMYLRLCVSVRIHKVVLCPAHMCAFARTYELPYISACECSRHPPRVNNKEPVKMNEVRWVFCKPQILASLSTPSVS